MREFVVIGLSTFGSVLAKRLHALKKNVLVIEQNKEKVQEFKDEVTQAIAADASDKKVLEKLLPEGEVTAVVSVGDDLGQSVIVTHHLKELGVKKIIAKAGNVDQGNVLKLVGATQIIYPEQDIALQIAEKLNNPNVLERVSLDEDYSLIELNAPPFFVGKSLTDMNLRQQHGVNVLAVKNRAQDTFRMPSSDYIFQENDIVVIMGESEAIEKISKKSSVD